MNYNNIILLSDMDGTLLNTNGIVSEQNKDALKEFVTNGGKFGIATGRNQMNSITFLDGIELNAPCILYNGGALYDFKTNQFLALCELKKAKLIEYLRFCMKEFPDIVILIFSPDQCSVISVKENTNPDFIAEHQPCEFCKIEDIIEKPWVKILFCAENQMLRSLEREMLKFDLEQNVHCVFSSGIYMEFLPYQTNKGSMLMRLRELMGKDYKIYAVGDYKNDIEMLNQAEVGIAVHNAHPDLKKIADFITVSNDESAIADVINHIL